MGATDNAFIRIFDDGHAAGDTGRLHSVAARQPSRGVPVATAVPSAVSQVYAGMTDSPPITLPLAVPEQEASIFESADDGTLLVVPEPHRQRDSQSTPTQGVSLRVDEADSATLRGPHIKPSALLLAAAGTVVTRDTALKLSTATIGEDTDESLDAEATDQVNDQVARVLSAINDLQPAGDDYPETATRITSAVWLPDWEVDRFRWPAVCSKLAEDSTAQLSDLVRPLLSDAWKGQNVIAVTSFARGEGASTVAMCMARMAASFNVSVALVDGDEESPSLGTSLGVAYDTDWNHAENERLAAAAIGSLEDKLVVLPLRQPNVDGPEQRLPSDDLARIVFELSDSFDLVIVDAGPMFSAAYRWFCDSVADTIDRTLLVQDVRNTAHAQIDDVCSRLKQAGMPAVAVVQNFHSANSERG